MANDKVTLDLLKARVMENGLELLETDDETNPLRFYILEPTMRRLLASPAGCTLDGIGEWLDGFEQWKRDDGRAPANDDDEPVTDRADLRQLRERAETLGFELSTATDCECAIYEAQSDHRVTFGTLAEVDEWLRENGPTYRLGSAQNCLYGIQALCDAQEEFNASLVGIVEREARLALAALERVERVLRGLQ